MQRFDERHERGMGNGFVVVHQVDRRGDVRAHIEVRYTHLASIHFDDLDTRNLAATTRQQRHIMAELDEPLGQPYENAFRAAVFADRYSGMVKEKVRFLSDGFGGV